MSGLLLSDADAQTGDVNRRFQRRVRGGSGLSVDGRTVGHPAVRRRRRRLGRRRSARGGAGVVSVEVLAADEAAVERTNGERVAANESTPTRDAAEAVDVVDAVAARSHHQVDAVEAEPTAATLDAE